MLVLCVCVFFFAGVFGMARGYGLSGSWVFGGLGVWGFPNFGV